MNPGFLESVAVGKRADVSVAPMGFANGTLDQRAYFDVMSKWMTECILKGADAAACMKSRRRRAAREEDHRLNRTG